MALERKPLTARLSILKGALHQSLPHLVQFSLEGRHIGVVQALDHLPQEIPPRRKGETPLVRPVQGVHERRAGDGRGPTRHKAVLARGEFHEGLGPAQDVP
eukprot:CAMPEP_0183307928 /NCGR_PEP_ID=MMETSP0160_2-20130417/19643_1 /TAXON_ID=2839 ORGANISM="Odontella Sinensis, Strain Grunow 1884" /NCGR_SAMPLE_ID=MMETSP0160_2 /ASSEMBLY_ACC=CAM_ASM_000250 /LENGTH=100 /DNA_ID=CAMNT_0025471649 /DNA_START=218 /DNA_END=518 /DNA_ORIENTATION=+